MTIKPEEITNIIKERISNFETRLQVDEVGTVLTVGDGVLGKVIGKKGRNVSAIRTLLSAATAKKGGKRSILEIIE